MSDTYAMPAPVTGQLRDKDLKRLVQETRDSVVGPTTTYYAGVTAPVIGASMAVVSSMALKATDMPTQWAGLLAVLTAAMAGIVWYLIFMRWSYRAKSGRDSERGGATTVTVGAPGLVIERGPITQHIAWSALKEVRDRRSYTLLCFDGAEPLIIPNSWFRRDKSAKESFQMFLKDKIA